MQQQNRSWFALITFCATTTLVAALGLALLFTGATVAYAVAHSLQAPASPPADANQPAPATQKISGMITDSKCAAKHAKSSRKNPAECTRACVRGGAKYTLVDGDKILGGSSQAAAVGGFPLISVPAGFVFDALAVGLTFMGPSMSEATLIKLAYAFEQAHPARRAPAYRPTIVDLP